MLTALLGWMAEQAHALGSERVSRLHPVETEAERLVLARELAGLAASVVQDVSQIEIRTLENKLFLASRFVAELANRRAKGTGNGKAARRVRLLVDAGLDVAAQATKITINLVMTHSVRRPVPVRRKTVYAVLVPSSQDLAEELRRPLEANGGFGWLILLSFRLRQQLELANALRMENKRPGLVPQIQQLRDLVRAFRRVRWRVNGPPGLRGRSWYVRVLTWLLLTELEAERRRVGFLRSTHCRVLITQDDCDYASVFRNSLLRQDGVLVVGLMHGIGLYGPNFDYSYYCIWGPYFRERFERMCQVPAGMLRITGRAGTTVRRAPNAASGSPVLLALQPVVPGNSREHVRELIQGALEATAGTSARVLVRLHPLQGRSVRRDLRRVLASNGERVALVDPRTTFGENLKECGVCVTNFSTAGLEAASLGRATVFYSKASRALVPMADYVPECRVERYVDYVSLLRSLVTSRSAREKLAADQARAATEFFADDPAGRYLALSEELLQRAGAEG